MSDQVLESNEKIPKNWLQVTMNDIIKIIDYRGRTPPYSSRGIPHLRSSNIKNGKIIWTNLSYVSEEAYQKFMTRGLPREGDILFTTEGPLGDVALVPTTRFSVAQRIMILRPTEQVYSKFLLYQLLSPDFQSKLTGKGTGTTVTGISSRNFRTIKVLVCSNNEQKRIVSKIEELFSILDSSTNLLVQVKKQLSQFRKSLLKSAFSGVLTEDWRKTHSDSSISSFLKQIEQKIPNESKEILKKIPNLKGSKLRDLPQTWAWVRLGDLIDMISGKAFKKNEYVNNGIRLFQIANVSFGEVSWKNLVYLPENYLELHPQLKLHSGDIVLALNRPILNNRLKITKLNPQDESCILYQRVGRLDFYENKVKDFVYHYLQSHDFIESLTSSLQGVDQPFVNKPKLLKIPIPLAPLEEQKIIINLIQSQLSEIQHNVIEVENMSKLIKKQKQSILKSAFEGNLVPQDPNDEPAEILLQKIKQEKQTIMSQSSKSRGRKNVN